MSFNNRHVLLVVGFLCHVLQAKGRKEGRKGERGVEMRLNLLDRWLAMVSRY
jgi:hypothetical protein